MKKLALPLTALVVVLSGCVAYPVPPSQHYGYRDGPARYERDRDRDGVPNAYDRRPRDPRYY